jgi:predicted nuclease of predicted toxin-antitoxin system
MNGFYFDEHMHRVAAEELIKRGHYVVMAVDVGMEGKDDDIEHLVYAAQQGLVMVTFDHPFAGRTMSRSDHPGLICLSYDLRTDVGGIVRTLHEFAQLYDAERDQGQVFWLP